MLSSSSTSLAGAWAGAFEHLNRSQPGIEGLLRCAEAWRTATSYLEPRPLNEQAQMGDIPTSAFQLLEEAKLERELLRWYLDAVRRRFSLMEEDLRRTLEEWEVAQDASAVPDLLGRLQTYLRQWQQPLQLFASLSPVPSFTTLFHTLLLNALPLNFPTFLRSYLITLPTDPAPPLAELGLQSMGETLLSGIVHKEIQRRVEEVRREWAEHCLGGLRAWVVNEVGWRVGAVLGASGDDQTFEALARPWVQRFDYHVCKTLCELRMTELFDIIVDYPDSLPALEDLKECLAKLHHREPLINALKASNSARLLHPGASTQLILTQYISTIRCLRLLDPPGVLLSKVAEPIRRYLRERPDTIRCIVGSLVDEENELLEELRDTPADAGVIRPGEEDYDDWADPEWEPEPIDAGPNFRTNTSRDIISTLVSIYDTKDVFVKELQIMLAQRLLLIKDYNLDKEIRNVEILKLRFGETALQPCQVMLKDVAHSKRIDQHITGQIQTPVHPTVISRLFWPTLQSGSLELPGQLATFKNDYDTAYAAFKPDKRLRWMPQLGTVTIELELQDRTLELEVSPVQASVIELFGENDRWTLDDLAMKLALPDSLATRSALYFWVNKGVVKEERQGVFRLLEVAEEGPVDAHSVVEDEQPAIQSTEEAAAEQVKIFWQFIQGMLTNLHAMPTERIQAMLAFAPGYDRSVEDLKAFLEAMAREGALDFRDGMWSLRK